MSFAGSGVSEAMQDFSVLNCQLDGLNVAANSALATEATRQAIILLEHAIGPLIFGRLPSD